MKANELMIGDWVSLNGLPNRVSILNGDAVVYEEPIPLTEEILKANGFECNEYTKVLRYKPYEIDVELGERYSRICIAELVYNPEDVTECNWQSDMEFAHHIYVHELQHALRLCGLNELADNFKIE